MNIDELALKVWAEVSTSTTVGQSIAKTFARALIAEYEADQGEAVAFIHRFQSGDSLSWFGESSDFASKADWLSMAPLYLRPDPRVKELEAQHTKDGVLIFQLDKANRELEEKYSSVCEKWHQAVDTYMEGNELLLNHEAKIAELERQLAEASRRNTELLSAVALSTPVIDAHAGPSRKACFYAAKGSE